MGYLYIQIFGFILPVGLQKILALLTSEDLDVQIHAVKVVANLAAEGIKDILYDESTQACPNRLMRLYNLLVVGSRVFDLSKAVTISSLLPLNFKF